MTDELEGRPQEAEASAPPCLPPPASIWRRVLAIMADSVFLFILGKALGAALSGVWYELGPYGAFVGLFAVCAYFGIAESSLTGRGQSFGKMLLGIAVRDSKGRPLGLGPAVLRTAILYLPSALSPDEKAMPPGLYPLLFGISTWAGFAIVCPILFGKSRRGLHDLLCGSCVVHLKGKGVESHPAAKAAPFAVSAALGAAVAASFFILLTALELKAAQAKSPAAAKLQNALNKDARILKAEVIDLKGPEDAKPGAAPSIALVNVRCKGNPGEAERKALEDFAASSADPKGCDILMISLESAYDIMIDKGRTKSTATRVMPGYEERAGRPEAPSSK